MLVWHLLHILATSILTRNNQTMWFNQMTCDCCYKPLRSTGRHNRYYFCKVLDFQKVTPWEYNMRYDFFNNPMDYRFNYDTSPYCINGYVYSYKTEPLRQNAYSTWYCSRECAVKEAKKANALLFYFDEEEGSVAFFTPHTVEINRAINESDYTPLLMMEWGEENWFQKRIEFKDLSMYGFETRYPEFSTRLCNIVKPNALLFEEYKKLVLDPAFEKDFWGSNGADMRNHIQQQFPNFLASVDVNFGRRLMIEWFITDKSNKFIGFIHLTCMYPAFPYKWVVEFGLVREYRGRGIMKTVLNGIVNWAKQNGCDEIYAISEDFNHPCHRLMNGLPYPVKETRHMMSDLFGGYRPMRNFLVSLK